MHVHTNMLIRLLTSCLTHSLAHSFMWSFIRFSIHFFTVQLFYWRRSSPSKKNKQALGGAAHWEHIMLKVANLGTHIMLRLRSCIHNLGIIKGSIPSNPALLRIQARGELFCVVGRAGAGGETHKECTDFQKGPAIDWQWPDTGAQIKTLGRKGGKNQ